MSLELCLGVTPWVSENCRGFQLVSLSLPLYQVTFRKFLNIFVKKNLENVFFSIGQVKKALLLHNLDPMFNIKTGFFFTLDENTGLNEQIERFSIFDLSKIASCTEWLPLSHLIARAVHIPPVKWNQYFISPWANSVEHEQKYESLMSKLGELKLDFQSACLLTIIALFDTGNIRGIHDLSEECIANIA